jgi:hypothetical protein
VFIETAQYFILAFLPVHSEPCCTYSPATAFGNAIVSLQWNLPLVLQRTSKTEDASAPSIPFAGELNAGGENRESEHLRRVPFRGLDDPSLPRRRAGSTFNDRGGGE